MALQIENTHRVFLVFEDGFYHLEDTLAAEIHDAVQAAIEKIVAPHRETQGVSSINVA